MTARPIDAAATADELIVGDGLSMVFDDQQPSLSDVSLRVAAGEFVSLVGPSGCGKSTLLRMVAGLREPTSGQLSVGGAAPSAGRVRTAFVFQEPNLLPWRTVADNIRLPLELDRDTAESRERQAAAVADAIRWIGLTVEDGAKRPRQLSGGMRMRVSLARALVTRPQLLLLDEPFAALDDMLRQQLNEDVRQLWLSQRWTALFVTHNVSEAVFLSDRVLVMSRAPGRLIAEVAVPFGPQRSPELRSDAAFARLCGEVSRQLRAAATGS